MRKKSFRKQTAEMDECLRCWDDWRCGRRPSASRHGSKKEADRTLTKEEYEEITCIVALGPLFLGLGLMFVAAIASGVIGGAIHIFHYLSMILGFVWNVIWWSLW